MVRQTFEQAERMGAPRALALCDHFGGALDFQTGRWAEAKCKLDRSLATYRQVGSASGEALCLQRLGLLLTARGELEQAMKVFDQGLLIAERASMRSHIVTRLQASIARNRLAADDLAAAARWIEEGTVSVRRHGNCSTCNALLLPEAVRVAVAQQDLDRAEQLVVDLEHTASEFNSRLWTAMARHARARLLAARGSMDEASAAFDEARQAYLAVDSLYDAARCLLGQARALRAAADPSSPAGAEASALEAKARAAFGELCAAGLED